MMLLKCRLLFMGLLAFVVFCCAGEQSFKHHIHRGLIAKLNEAILKSKSHSGYVKVDRATEWELGRMRIVNGTTETVPSIYEPWKYVGKEHENGTDEIIDDGDGTNQVDTQWSNNKDAGMGKRKFMFPVGSTKLWSNGIVVYKFATNKFRFKNPSSQPLIERAMKWYEENTCIKWMEYSTQVAAIVGHHDYVEIGIGTGGCSAHMGRVKNGKLNLMEPQCLTMSTVLHEMGHTLGMHHEQVRDDRDEHITMKWRLIPEAQGGINWGKTNTFNYAPYDLGSNMHYSLYSGSKVKSKMAMEPKDMELAFLASFHRPGGMSFYDMEAINHGYKCADDCILKPQCQNGGYVNFKCQCQCPSNLIGAFCEVAKTDSDCGGVFTVTTGSPLTISSPNSPSHYPRGKVCTWLLKGPVGSTVSLDIQDFDIPHSGFKVNMGKRVKVCVHTLEVRYNLVAQPGPEYCGKNWQKGLIHTTKYAESMMMVRFSSEGEGTTGKGFRAVVTAHFSNQISGCIAGLCQNGGTCVSGPNGAVCYCTSGFSGTHCEKKKVCSPAVCRNGGTCIPRGHRFVCSCMSGFRGRRCDKETNSPTSVITCSFEDQRTGIFTQDTNDDADWTIISGPTPSSRTGPTHAYRGRHYIYLEGSSPVATGHRARLTSVTLSAIPRCVRFHYHMYGSGMGSLHVKKIAGGVESLLWSKFRNQGDMWWQADVTVRGHMPYQIVFEATRGSSWRSDIGLDEVTILPTPCPSRKLQHH